MAQTKNFASPDETRRFVKGQLQVVEVNGLKVGRAHFEPGWRWSECVRPIAKTNSCQVEHLVYVIQGRMALRYDDGTTQEVGPGDLAHMPPGHDAWIVGNEAFDAIDFAGAPSYAVKK